MHLSLAHAKKWSDAAAFQQGCCSAFVTFARLVVGFVGCCLVMAALQVQAQHGGPAPRWRRLSRLLSIWLGANDDANCREVVYYFWFVALLDVAVLSLALNLPVLPVSR